MVDSLLIGETEINGRILPVYATNTVVSSAIRVDYNYSGYDDPEDRTLILVEEVTEALRAGQREMSHVVPDRSWTGNPDHIESERIALAIKVGPNSVTVDIALRKIDKTDPSYSRIATEALKKLKSFDQRRDV